MSQFSNILLTVLHISSQSIDKDCYEKKFFDFNKYHFSEYQSGDRMYVYASEKDVKAPTIYTIQENMQLIEKKIMLTLHGYQNTQGIVETLKSINSQLEQLNTTLKKTSQPPIYIFATKSANHTKAIFNVNEFDMEKDNSSGYVGSKFTNKQTGEVTLIEETIDQIYNKIQEAKK